MKKKIRLSFCFIIILSLLLGKSIYAADIIDEKTEEATEIAEPQIPEKESVTEDEPVTEQEKQGAKPEEKEDTNKEIESQKDRASFDTMQTNLVMYKGLPVRISLQAPTDRFWSSVSDNESVCEIVQQTAYGYASGSDFYRIDVELQAVSTGTTKIKLADYDDSVADEITITVKEMPGDAVPIKDAYLNGTLLGVIESTTSYDTDKNGYLSFEEMKQIKSLTIVNGVKNIAGVEYAENLESISLWGNESIQDITPLKNLKNLVDIDLRQTNISDKDRWELADFKDMTVNPGQIFCLPVKGCLFEVENYDKASIDVTVLSGDDSVIQKRYISNGRIYYIGALPGKAELKVQYKTFSKNIVISVEGQLPEQEVGNLYNGTSDIGYKYIEGKETEVTILKQNGELWKLNPEPEKIAEHIEQQFFGVSYLDGPNQKMGYYYYLDKDGTLWSDGIVLASNVKTCDDRYALTNDNILLDIYTEGTKALENVESWQQIDKTYALKKDGTLWARKEVSKGEAVNQFECIAKDVKQMNTYYYITSDGTLYLLSGDSVEEPVKVKYLLGLDSGWEGYYGEDGWTRISYGAIIDEPAKEIYAWYFPQMAFLVRTQDNQLFRVEEAEEGKYEKQLLTNDFGDWMFTSTDCAYQTKNGAYYNQFGTMITPSKENPIIIQNLSTHNPNSYQVMNIGDESNLYVEKNGIKILDYVKNIFCTTHYGVEQGERVYAERIDGTIWDITTVPKQILTTAVLVKGDVSGDGQTSLSDLITILRYTSGKETLTSEQLKAADVTGDGKVTLTDLIKILQFVNHKIPQL